MSNTFAMLIIVGLSNSPTFFGLLMVPTEEKGKYSNKHFINFIHPLPKKLNY